MLAHTAALQQLEDLFDRRRGIDCGHDGLEAIFVDLQRECRAGSVGISSLRDLGCALCGGTLHRGHSWSDFFLLCHVAPSQAQLHARE